MDYGLIQIGAFVTHDHFKEMIFQGAATQVEPANRRGSARRPSG